MDAYAAYAQQAATTASPAQLVLMLYDGALARVEAARVSLTTERPDVETAHTSLTKAQAIVEQLKVTLDHDAGGGLADNLAGLYAYCLEKLLQANIAKDAAPLDEVTDLLSGLREAWDDACVQGSLAAAVG